MIRMEEKQPAGVHCFSLENRRKAVITGVQDIHSFNENEVLHFFGSRENTTER